MKKLRRLFEIAAVLVVVCSVPASQHSHRSSAGRNTLFIGGGAGAGGDLQSIYFLNRESSGSNDVWRYYSLVRTGRSASKRIIGHEASSVNRAVAFYRYLAGMPTNMELTAAR